MGAEHQYERLTLNHDKTTVATKPDLGAITGVYVENDGRLSAGEVRSQAVVAGIQRAIGGRLAHREIVSLKGLLSFVLQVEPAFLAALNQEFGSPAVEAIRRCWALAG